jgi:GTP cyclohydrolase I
MATFFTDSQIAQDTIKLAGQIKKSGKKYDSLYAVPTGGFPVAAILSEILDIPLCYYNHNGNVLIVDDLIDSGETLSQLNGDKAVLHVKGKKTNEVNYFVKSFPADEWLVYPWENYTKEAKQIVQRMIQFIGEDVNREGLQETPDRVARSWEKLYGGYNENPDELLKVFDSGTYDQMVVLKDIEFYSTCEHHILPFMGRASIAYIPEKKVIGVSKLARLLEIFSRRLQIQERIGEQITDFLMDKLQAKGAACVLDAQHLCMTSRGVEKQHSRMVTSSLKGVFVKPEVRGEFLQLIKS